MVCVLLQTQCTNFTDAFIVDVLSINYESAKNTPDQVKRYRTLNGKEEIKYVKYTSFQLLVLILSMFELWFLKMPILVDARMHQFYTLSVQDSAWLLFGC